MALTYSKSSSLDVKILVTLPDGEGGVRAEEFMAEDLSQEDVIGVVMGFEAVAADGSVGASEVAWFPGLVGRAEGVSNVLWELRVSGGVDGLWARKALESPEPVESLDNFLCLGQRA